MNVFQRSWHITKLTFSVIRKDKIMLLFPVLSGFFSILFILAMVVPSLVLPGIGETLEWSAFLILFLVYLGLALITVFFDVCVVYVAKKRFSGEPVGFSETISYAFSKFGLIFQWALVSAIVGLLLRLLDSLGRQKKGPLAVVARVVSSLLGMAWSIITIFVVPALVYDNKKPIPAIKHSASTLKKTWGESLIRYFGFGIMQFLIMFVGGLLFFILIVAGFALSPILGVILLLIAGIFFVLVFLTFHIAHDVFNTALYEYANFGKIPEGFDKETIENAFAKDSRV